VAYQAITPLANGFAALC